MGKYTEHEKSKVLKIDVALLQIEDSIRLFLSGHYYSSITLAGAADSIFCGHLTANGEKTPAERTWEQIEAVRSLGVKLAGDRTNKDAFNEWNSARNRLKHHDAGRDGEVLEIFEIDEAYESVKRAIHSAGLLGRAPRNGIEFENYTIKWFFLS